MSVDVVTRPNGHFLKMQEWEAPIDLSGLPATVVDSMIHEIEHGSDDDALTEDDIREARSEGVSHAVDKIEAELGTQPQFAADEIRQATNAASEACAKLAVDNLDTLRASSPAEADEMLQRWFAAELKSHFEAAYSDAREAQRVHLQTFLDELAEG